MDPFAFLKPRNTFTGIDTLRVNPLYNKYYEEIYSEYGSPEEGLAIGPYLTPDSFTGTGFYENTDMGYPSAPANRLQGLDLSRFQGVSDLGRDDEDVEQVDYVPGAEPKTGIAKLLEVLGKIPTPLNLARRGIESLSRIPRSDFFRSKNLMDYLDMRRYGSAEARERARQKNLRETAAIQKQLDLRTAAGKYDDGGDRGRGQIPTRTTSAPTRSFSKSYSDAKSAFTAGR